jgi:hypothetical protein
MAGEGSAGQGAAPTGREKAVFSDGFKELAEGLAKLRRNMLVALKELEYARTRPGTREYEVPAFSKMATESFQVWLAACETAPKEITDCLNEVGLDQVPKERAFVALEVTNRRMKEVMSTVQKLAEAKAPPAFLEMKKAQLDFAGAFLAAMAETFGDIAGWLKYEGQYVDKHATFSMRRIVNMQPYVDRWVEAASAANRQLEAEQQPAKKEGCGLVLALAAAALWLAA